MADRKAAKNGTKTPAKRTSAKAFSDEERDAMKERAREARAGKAGGESDVLAKIAQMPAAERRMAERIHAIVKANAPGLEPKTWYGMPAYAKAGKVVCHFQSATKFKTRYPTFAFSDQAKLDQGNLWPVAFALKELTAADEAKLSALVKQAVS